MAPYRYFSRAKGSFKLHKVPSWTKADQRQNGEMSYSLHLLYTVPDFFQPHMQPVFLNPNFRRYFYSSFKVTGQVLSFAPAKPTGLYHCLKCQSSLEFFPGIEAWLPGHSSATELYTKYLPKNCLHTPRFNSWSPRTTSALTDPCAAVALMQIFYSAMPPFTCCHFC